MNPMHMRLAVVVPCLDEERHLPALLDSIAGQSRVPDELVVVDDGSTDASVAIATRFAQEHAYARVLPRPPRPPARDRLVAAAELVAVQWAVAQLSEPWDVVGKLDADLVLAPDTLATLEGAFQADAGLGMAGAYLSEPARGGA